MFQLLIPGINPSFSGIHGRGHFMNRNVLNRIYDENRS
jgi:hypothetical protein